MGIVNVTPDSFSDGGAYADAQAAAEAGADMTAAGAAILDVGGESTRPGAKIGLGRGRDRARPAGRAAPCGGRAARCRSIRARLRWRRQRWVLGARLVNDVSAMHIRPAHGRDSGCDGDADRADASPGRSADDAGRSALRRCSGRCLPVAGTSASRTPRKPGSRATRSWSIRASASARPVAHNLELLNGLAIFHGLGCPIVLGASRKRMIGALGERGAGRPAPCREPCTGD